MDIQMDIREPATPAPFDDVSYWRTDDSGYHTSITPGSTECSELSNENVDPLVGKRLKRQRHVNHEVKDVVLDYHRTPQRKNRRLRSAAVTPDTHPDSPLETPFKRRGTKRPYQEDLNVSSVSFTSVPTPTSIIAGGITKLKVNDIQDAARFSQSPIKSNVPESDSCSYSSYPVTPVKKVCRSNSSVCNDSHNSSPLQTINNICCSLWRSPNKHSLVCHSLDGEIEQVNQSKPQFKDVRPVFRTDQKIDIIGMLSTSVNCVPAIQKVLDYLSRKDMHMFSLVSPLWKKISDEMPKAMKMKKEFQDFITNTKENSENRLSERKTRNSPRESNYKMPEFLKDHSNLANLRSGRKLLALRSPPHSPRTRKFKTFVKSASLDSARIQLPCVRCSQPAIVNEETSGEQWLECISVSCSYKFCRYCKCERHPNKSCFKYDLDGCSPKRKLKSLSSAAGTKKSKKNLRRLLDFN